MNYILWDTITIWILSQPYIATKLTINRGPRKTMRLLVHVPTLMNICSQGETLCSHPDLLNDRAELPLVITFHTVDHLQAI